MIDVFLNSKQFYAHKPIETITALSKIETLSVTKSKLYAFERTNWEKLNESIEQQPFLLFCYSNFDELLLQWYQRLWGKIDKNCPSVIKYRANLTPKDFKFYIKYNQATEYTLKKQIKCSLGKLIKVKRPEKQFKQSSNYELRDYEESVFEERKILRFKNI